jgi:hypothetical protein
MYVSSVLSVLRSMLQVLYLDVSKVDRELHLAFSSSSVISSRCLQLLSTSAGHPNQRRSQAPPPPLLLDASGTLWDGGTAEDGPPRVHVGHAPSVPLCGGGIGALDSSVTR